MLKFLFYLMILLTAGTYTKVYFVQQSIDKLQEKMRIIESIHKSVSLNKTIITSNRGSDTTMSKKYSLVSYTDTSSKYILRTQISNLLETDKYYAIYMIMIANSSLNKLSQDELKAFVTLLKETYYRKFSSLLDDIFLASRLNSKEIKIAKKRLSSTVIECLMTVDSRTTTKDHINKVVSLWEKVNKATLINSIDIEKKILIVDSLRVSLLTEAYLNKLFL